jgi:hypothetical protein
MRAMAIPTVTPAEVLNACIETIANDDLKRRVQAIQNDLLGSGIKYQAGAALARLYLLQANRQANDEILVGAVTKAEVKTLYTYNLVRTPAGRVHYDALIASAPKGICPLCGAGVAATLDHFLPKGAFPLFSILPINLVPACRDCNTGKLSAFAAMAGDQTLHPYFDHGLYINDRWLKADVVASNPASLRFYTSPPDQWDDENKQRIEAHFRAFKLGHKYAVLAASELSSLIGLLANHVGIGGIDEVRRFLLSCAVSESRIHLNSWRSAMFNALAESAWFCEHGYR